MAQSVAGEACAVHEGRPAVERCARCGRTVCLDCAIPVRGRVLCTGCAAAEVGAPAPTEEPRRKAGRLDVFALALFSAGTIMSVLPWERPGPSGRWRLLVAGLLLVGTSIALRRVLGRGPGRPRPTGGGYVTFGFLAASATIVILLAAPAFEAHTAFPYAVLVVGLTAAGLGILRLIRRGP